MKMIRYDTHAHIDLYKNMREQLDCLESKKSYTVVMTNLPDLYKKYIEEYPNFKYIRFALGLHPELAVQYKSQLALFNKLVKGSRYIGEIGLDFTRKIDREQIRIFTEIIKSCESHGNKIISIHSRGAASKVIEIVGRSENKIILHWFSGTIEELERAIELNYYFSINSNMISSKKGQEIVKRVPQDKLLIESDAPFTNLTKNNYNLGFMEFIFSKTATILSKSIDDVKVLYSNNFLELLE